MSTTDPKIVTQRVIDSIYPILSEVIQSPEAAAVQARIRTAIGNLVTTMNEERRAAMQAQRARMNMSREEAIAEARDEERTEAAQQRQQDATVASQTQQQAVAAVRADEQQKCAGQRQQDATAATGAQHAAVAAARQDEQQKCASLRAQDAATAAADKVAAIAAAKTSERVKCVQEIAVAPVTGITIGVTLFAGSMRDQIKNYVATGPH